MSSTSPPELRAGWFNLHKSIGLAIAFVMLALTADGGKLYVANGRSNSACVIDTRSAERIADIPVGELSWGVAVR